MKTKNICNSLKFSKNIITLENLFYKYLNENRYLGKKNIRKMLNTIKLNIPEFWFISISEINEKELHQIFEYMKNTGKKKESLRLSAYLKILLTFAQNNDINIQ